MLVFLHENYNIANGFNTALSIMTKGDSTQLYKQIMTRFLTTSDIL